MDPGAVSIADSRQNTKGGTLTRIRITPDCRADNAVTLPDPAVSRFAGGIIANVKSKEANSREIDMKRKVVYGVISAALLSISASYSWAEQVTGPADADTSAPVDCSTAKDDISTLEHEKKKTSDKAVGGILAFTPIGLVTNVATGGDKMDEEQKLSAEEYNKKIDERIAQIKKACPDAAALDSPAFSSD